MKIAKFDRKNLKDIRLQINSELEKMSKKLGIQFSIGNISFQEKSFTTKMSAVLAGDSAEAAKIEFEKNCWRAGVNKDMFGKVISYAGKSYKICGIKPRSWKRPILAERNGSQYKFAKDFAEKFTS